MTSSPDTGNTIGGDPNSEDLSAISAGRGRRVGHGLVGNVGFKAVSTLVNFATVPIALRCLASERYSMWFAITSYAAVLGFSDLGMGNGLLNAISVANAKDDKEGARRAVSSAFFLLGYIALAIIALTLITLPVVSWARMFNVKSPLAITEAGPAMAIFVICTALQMPLGVVMRVQYGYQEVFRNSVWQVAGLVASFVALWIAAAFHMGLPALLLAYVGTGLAVNLLNFLIEFLIRRPWLRPKFAARSSVVAKGLFTVGIAFLVLQLSNWLAVWSDNLVVSQVLGATSLTVYAIAFKLFFAAMVFQYIGPSLWPAFTEAITRGDYAWARRTFYRGFWLNTAMSAVIAVFLYFTSPWIILHWAGRAQVPTKDTIFAFCIWLFVYSYVGVFAALCNGGRNLAVHATLFCLASVTAVPLRIAFARASGSQTGVVNASTLAFGVLYVLPMILVIYRYFKLLGSAATPVSGLGEAVS